MSVSRRACPVCGRGISIGRVAFGSEAWAFHCSGCNTRLMKKSVRVGTCLAGFSLWFLVKETYGWGSWVTWVSAAALLVFIGVLSVLVVKVRVATADDPDRPKSPPPEKVPDGPPPFDPTFRGKSPPRK
jgi:hypothetical protein